MPLVSVIMPTRNDERDISLAITSILAQDYADWELIVVNDASTDATPTLLQNFAARDQRVVVLDNKRNLGRALSRNRAIEAAQGDFIAILDADDIAMPQRLSHQAAYLQDHPEVVILGAWAIAIDSGNQPLEPLLRPTHNVDIRRQLTRLRMPFVHSTVMFRREAVRAAGLYDARFLASEDFHLCYRVVQQGEAASLPEFLVLYRVNTSPDPALVRNRYRWGYRAGWDVFKRRPGLLGGFNLARLWLLGYLPEGKFVVPFGVYKGNWDQKLLTEKQAAEVRGWVERLKEG